MSSRKHTAAYHSILVAFVALTVQASCVTPKEAVIVSSRVQSRSAKDILDLPFDEVDNHGYGMQETLDKISHAIESRSGGRLHFAFGVGSSRSVELARAGKYSELSKWRLRDPIVHIRASHTTLRAIIDTLYQQSGWSYTFTPAGYMFIDNKSYFE
jgi:hypothetical protein